MKRIARSFAAKSLSFEETQADYRTFQVAHFGAPLSWALAEPKRWRAQ